MPWLPGFFQSAKRAPLRSSASCLLPARPASLQDLAADLVHRIGRCLHDVKWVKANHSVWAALGDGPSDPLGVIVRHQLDLLAVLFTQQSEELLNFSTVWRSRP